MAKAAVVTGCSSGIGYETALSLARHGYKTYATMRNASKSKEILDAAAAENLDLAVTALDVSSKESIDAAMDEILDREGRIDVLVNNAGYVMFGTLEEVSISEFREQFETNFFGIINLLHRAVPAMRKQGGGRIVNISSVAGRIGLPCTSAYISSKFALEGLSESLRYEVDQFNIKVVLIEPGVIKSNLFNSMKVAGADGSSPYSALTKGVLSGIGTMAELGTPPADVASAVIRAIQEKEPQPRYIVGKDAAMFLDIKKAKTDLEFEKYLKEELFASQEPR